MAEWGSGGDGSLAGPDERPFSGGSGDGGLARGRGGGDFFFRPHHNTFYDEAMMTESGCGGEDFNNVLTAVQDALNGRGGLAGVHDRAAGRGRAERGAGAVGRGDCAGERGQRERGGGGPQASPCVCVCVCARALVGPWVLFAGCVSVVGQSVGGLQAMPGMPGEETRRDAGDLALRLLILMKRGTRSRDWQSLLRVKPG